MNESPADESVAPTDGTMAVRRGTRALWAPLVFVMVVLAALAAIPLGVSMGVRQLTGAISGEIDPARVSATDLEASVAEEMLVVGASPRRAAHDTVFRDAHASEHRDALQLDSLLPFVGPSAVELFGQYREAATRWHDDVATLAATDSSAPVLAKARADGIAALQAVNRLEVLLDSLADSRRAATQRIARLNVLLPSILFPLALLAFVLIVRAGRQTVASAIRADENRRALAAAAEARSQLIRGISHDLQNPLGAALGHIELVLEAVVHGDDARTALSRARRLIASASDTVASLLTLARTDGADLRLAASKLDLSVLTEAAVDDHRPLASSRQQSIEFERHPDCIANADAARVRHIIDNLLSNAIKYTPSGGRIRVWLETRKRAGRRCCAVVVEDSGPGVPAEWRDRIFEEFARVPEYEHLAAGSGIGLAVSRRAAQMMGGDIVLSDVDAANDKSHERLGGARFALLLPMADGRRDQPARAD